MFHSFIVLVSVPICISLVFCSLCLCVVGFSTVPAVEHTLVFVQETPRVTLLGVLFLFVQLFDASEQPPSESL